MHDHLQSVRHLAEVDAGKEHNVHRTDALPRGQRVDVEFVNLEHERDLCECVRGRAPETKAKNSDELKIDFISNCEWK